MGKSTDKPKKEQAQPSSQSEQAKERQRLIWEENLAATPGSTQGGTLAGTPSPLAGATPGHDPQSPKRVPPYGDIDVTPEGTVDGGVIGTTTGDTTGSTAGGRPGSMTGYKRTLKPEDLPPEKER